MAHLVIVVLSVYVTLTLGVDPYGCTYNQADVREYICSARSWSLPLVYSDFVNIPQVLKLVDVDGYLPFQSPATFSGFESMNTSVMDTSIVPALHIRCVSGGSLIMSNGTFSNMGWVKEVRIFDCAILTIPDDVFSSFGTLNYFSIDGGSISNMGVNCFSGVNVERMESVPQPLGMFAIRNSRLTSGELVSGVLYPLINTSIILLENTDMGVINKDLFQTSTRVQYISLKDNPFTYLPDGLFDTVTSLTTFQVSGVNWTCTCKNMWIVTYMKTNNISLIGDIGCASPEAYYSKCQGGSTTFSCNVFLIFVVMVV